jgi:NAD dependent epimerase/dehydratase family enzyme
MVSAILHIESHQALEGAINLTAENAVSNKTFTKVLANTLKKPSIFTTPALILKIIFGEMAELLLYGQNVVPSKLLKSGFTFKYSTIDNALKSILNKN